MVTGHPARTWSLVVTWNGRYELSQLNLDDRQVTQALIQFNALMSAADVPRGEIRVQVMEESPIRH